MMAVLRAPVRICRRAGPSFDRSNEVTPTHRQLDGMLRRNGGAQLGSGLVIRDEVRPTRDRFTPEADLIAAGAVCRVVMPAEE
jgi:hypothetical protein